MNRNLLDHNSDAAGYTSSEFHSLDMADGNSSGGSIFQQRKTVRSWLYYGMIGTIAVLTLLVILLAAGWANAKEDEKGNPAPPPPQNVSSSTAMPPSSSGTWSSPSSSAAPSSSSWRPSNSSSSSSWRPSNSSSSSSSSTSPFTSSMFPSSSSTGVNPVQPDQPNVLLPTVPSYPSTTLVGQIKTYTLMSLLSGVYEIAMRNGGNRVITGPGHNATVEYLLDKIATRTNLVNVERTYFRYNVGGPSVQNTQFISTVNSTPYSYPFDWAISTRAGSISNSTSNNVPLVFISNPCDEQLWKSAQPDPGQVLWAIVFMNYTECESHLIPIEYAEYYRYTGIILRMDSLRNPPQLYVNGITIGVVTTTRDLGDSLITPLRAGSSVNITINFEIFQNYAVVSNICGDTPEGDPTSVVLVGGHSDGVARGPGTNDDGSGAISTLVLAIALTDLMNNASLNYKLPNMVKFCWFGGEEQGLLGSYEVVRVAVRQNSNPNARVGTRARDWALMIDLDMLGSMNFQNFIYDANNHIPPSTPSSAVNGSKTMTNYFFEFFQKNNLPADSDRFDGRSDYGPFLAVGIPAGGVDAGADKVKNESTRERYQRMTGWGGVANRQNDQCYHQPCDTIANIHWGVYTNMTMSAAYVLEKFALNPNLRASIDLPFNATDDADEINRFQAAFERDNPRENFITNEHENFGGMDEFDDIVVPIF